MANPTIDWATKNITIPQSFLTLVSGSLYELDVNKLRLALKDIEDSEEGMGFEDTHQHNTESVLSGVTYARQLKIINGYTVTFENGQYIVRCIGANHNLADVKNANYVSLIIGNSAGLVVGSGGITDQDKQDIADLIVAEGVLLEPVFTNTINDLNDFNPSTEQVTVQTNNDKTNYKIAGTKTKLDDLNDFDPSQEKVVLANVGNLSSDVVLKRLLSMASGKITKNGSVYTFYDENNTLLYSFTLTETGRIPV